MPKFVADSSVSPTGLKWAVDPVADVVTTAGDLLYATAADTVTRLGIGTASQVLAVNSGATAPEWVTPAAGGGKVLQVVSATSTTSTNIASTSLTDSTITATITPSLASSKILVLISCRITTARDTNTSFAFYKVLRGATTVFDATANSTAFGGEAIGATRVRHCSQLGITLLDDPNTTSATTYKLQGAAETTSNSGQVIFQINGNPSTITLLEIGA